MKFKHGLGSEAKTIVTNLKGIIVSRSENLFGCNRYVIQPQAVGKEQKVPDSFWIDEDDLVVLKENKVPRIEKNTGGPMQRIVSRPIKK